MIQPETQKIRILIVDDHQLFREGLGRLLDAEPDFTTTQCASVGEALQIIGEAAVDLVLLDYDLGIQRGSELLNRARLENFQGRILIVTAGLSDRDAAELLRGGAAGIFTKHSPPELLVRCVRTVMQGEPWIDSRYKDVLLRSPEPNRSSNKARFTEKERAILRGVFEGLANKEIAALMNTSETSVKGLLQQVFDKTGVRTRGQLVRVVLEQYGDQL